MHRRFTLDLGGGSGLLLEFDPVTLGWFGIFFEPPERKTRPCLPHQAPTVVIAAAAALGVDPAEVPGAVHAAAPRLEAHARDGERFLCPCCGYRTLFSRGRYEICPVCNWEDEGDRPLDEGSGPNHRTLREGRALYAATGSSSERALEHGRVRPPLPDELPGGVEPDNAASPRT